MPHQRHPAGVPAAGPLSTRWRLWWLGGLAAALLAACGAPPPTQGGQHSSPSATATAGPPASPVGTVAVSVSGKVEPVLIDSAGRTLYYFTPDTPTAATCTGSCITLWPPLLTTASSLLAPSGVTGALSVLHGANGAQVEYQGHPLYTYSGDTGPGQANGEGVLGKWFVATPGLAPAPTAAASPTPSPSSGGSGY
ncbi:MAG TPA: hypothetical protein VMW49_05795 [Candidatus Dormibacteraeota bacterium]|nr:hypothetical protein [Candidatus Dormibacteraeota bacterium]